MTTLFASALLTPGQSLKHKLISFHTKRAILVCRSSMQLYPVYVLNDFVHTIANHAAASRRRRCICHLSSCIHSTAATEISTCMAHGSLKNIKGNIDP